jgi:uroporphyrinogen-III synthase
MRVLVTRPEPDCARTARALRERGHDVVVSPLMRIEPIVDARIGAGPWGAVVFTSANAAHGFASHPLGAELLATPVFTVGARTAAAAWACGFAEVRPADGDAAALAGMIAASGLDCTRPLLYPAGEDRARDLAELLAPHGLKVETVAIYRAVIVDTLSREARVALVDGTIDAVLHFSRRSAQAFVAATKVANLRAEGLALRHLCLSAEIASVLIAAGAKQVTIAPRADQQTLLNLLDHLRGLHP